MNTAIVMLRRDGDDGLMVLKEQVVVVLRSGLEKEVVVLGFGVRFGCGCRGV